MYHTSLPIMCHPFTDDHVLTLISYRMSSLTADRVSSLTTDRLSSLSEVRRAKCDVLAAVKLR
jgi:hypothetical protein